MGNFWRRKLERYIYQHAPRLAETPTKENVHLTNLLDRAIEEAAEWSWDDIMSALRAAYDAGVRAGEERRGRRYRHDDICPSCFAASEFAHGKLCPIGNGAIKDPRPTPPKEESSE